MSALLHTSSCHCPYQTRGQLYLFSYLALCNVVHGAIRSCSCNPDPECNCLSVCLSLVAFIQRGFHSAFFLVRIGV